MDKKKISILVLAILSIGIVSAALVTYLSNTATVTVDVTSPMTVQFAEVDHGVGVVSAINNVDGVGTWFDNLILTGTTGLSTSDLGLKIENNADVDISNKILNVEVSNDLLNVDCADISSLTFIDVGASVGTTYYQVVQELAGIGLCTDDGASIRYSIPINLLEAGNTYKYPVTITFGNVAPATYTIDATVLI